MSNFFKIIKFQMYDTKLKYDCNTNKIILKKILKDILNTSCTLRFRRINYKKLITNSIISYKDIPNWCNIVHILISDIEELLNIIDQNTTYCLFVVRYDVNYLKNTIIIYETYVKKIKEEIKKGKYFSNSLLDIISDYLFKGCVNYKTKCDCKFLSYLNNPYVYRCR